MNVTREVMTDLLPVYFSGEASEDTKQLVEIADLTLVPHASIVNHHGRMRQHDDSKGIKLRGCPR